MRKILFLTITILGYYLPAFSQSSSQLQIDTTALKFGFFNNPKTLGHIDTIDFKQLLNNPKHHKYLLNPKLADKNVHFGQLSNGRIKAPHSLDNMPCHYPQGSFPMPICKPDSTVKYSLLIKNINNQTK